jgi:hypothetical protein
MTLIGHFIIFVNDPQPFHNQKRIKKIRRLGRKSAREARPDWQ